MYKDSIATGFSHVYSSSGSREDEIEQDGLLVVTVKIKTDLGKLQEIPQQIVAEMEALERYRGHSSIDNALKKALRYPVTLAIVYYGDAHFELADKRHFQLRKVRLMGRELSLKM